MKIIIVLVCLMAFVMVSGCFKSAAVKCKKTYTISGVQKVRCMPKPSSGCADGWVIDQNGQCP